MTTSAQIADAVDALADHVADQAHIDFWELHEFLEQRGIDTVEREQLTTDHLQELHPMERTTLACFVSHEYIRIVRALFHTAPVILTFDPISSYECGHERWWIAWAGNRDTRDALVDAAIEFVRDQGAVDFTEIADFLCDRGVPVQGDLAMMLGQHPVGDGDHRAPWRRFNPKNIVLWSSVSAEFLAIVELMLKREPSVVFERTSVGYYSRPPTSLMGDCLDAAPPTRPPLLEFGCELPAGGYEQPTWLPAVFAWAGGD